MRRALLLVCLGVIGCGGEAFDLGTPALGTNEDAAGLPETKVVDVGAEAKADAEVEADADADANADADAVVNADVETDEVSDTALEASVDALACDTPVTCWVDADGDGYAAADAKSIYACSCPKNTTTRSPAVTIDCNDEDSRVKPGATAFYVEPYCMPGTGCATKSFDYDCSGTLETQYGKALFSGCSAGSCMGQGWTSGAPACGESASWTSCKLELLTCTKPSVSLKQACR